MASTPKTVTLVGDLKKATPSIRTHSLYSFSSPVVLYEEAIYTETIATGDSWTVPLSSVDAGATMLFLASDPEQDGTLDVMINDAPLENAFPVGPGGIVAVSVTSISSLVLANSSGAPATVYVFGGGGTQ